MLFPAYEARVPRESDLVCYWFVKAGEQMGAMDSTRVGLVATNSIRGGANRRALMRATSGRPAISAWSDEMWPIDGVEVRDSLVCFSQLEDKAKVECRLDGDLVDEIYTDLTARSGETGVEMTMACRLARNTGVAFMGDTNGGSFDISGDLAWNWLREPANPNNRPNFDVLKPRMNGMAVTRRPADKWIIDFGRAKSRE